LVRLAALLRRIKPDIVHTNTVKAHVVGIPAAKMLGVPSVLHVRDTLAKFDRWMLSSIGRYGATSVVAVSRHIADWYAIPSTDVIYNPFERVLDADRPSREEARARFGISGSAPVLGIVGAIHRNKGHERFLRSIAALLKEVDVAGMIVGDARSTGGARDAQLRDCAAALGISEKIFFVPWLEDVRSAYAAIDILCNCSTREPFGRTIVEAAELAIPSAMFDDCGASEVLVDGISAAVSPAHDEDAYARRLHHLATDPQQRQAMGIAAREAVKDLTPERHAGQVVALYEGLRTEYLPRKVRSKGP
jgi:glycosyltransferase involved in cell wall biosynthesis